MLGGRYAIGGWLGVSVSVTNDGAPTEGYVSAETADGTVRSFLEMPAGSRKAISLYLRPEAFQRNVTVTFEDSNGSVAADADVQVMEQSNMQVAVVGDGGGALRAQLIADGSSTRPEPISIVAAVLPDRPEPLHGLSTIVWAADSAAVSDAQRDSLERWVSTGGQLIVIGGPDWQARASAFLDLLPVESIAGYEVEDLSGFTAFTGEPLPDDTPRTAAGGSLRDGATPLIEGDDQPALLSMTTHGAGRVIYSALDLSTDSYRGWLGAAALWSRLVPNDAWMDQFFGSGIPREQEKAGQMNQALGNLPALDVPPAELLLIVVVGYIVLIGPISYIVLRRIDRRELAWLTAPALVIVFTACSYGIGSSLKGTEIIVNQISLLRIAAGSDTAAVETYAGIFSPERATYDLTIEADALVAPISGDGFEGVPTAQSDYLADQGDPAHLRGLEVGVYGFQALRADAIIDHAASLDVDWHVSEGDLIGTVTNVGDQALEDVAVVAVGAGEMIGDLGPGESKDFEVQTLNFNGSTTSDQIYGFGGAEITTAEQREVQLRRQVIDALVGYASIPGRALGLGASSDRGPFVIGWRAESDDAPLPVVIDEQQVQYHQHVVEVVSGRPEIDAGVVTVAPSQMSVQVASLEGDASADDAFVSVGNGEVVFAISLPLELAELAPSEITIFAGPDPSMVLQDPGSFGGFFPPGFTLSVRDPETGEWEELGDLSQSSSWEIDDPSTLLDQTGRIEVRVSGEEIDDTFGQTGLWVSAEISGQVAR